MVSITVMENITITVTTITVTETGTPMAIMVTNRIRITGITASTAGTGGKASGVAAEMEVFEIRGTSITITVVMEAITIEITNDIHPPVITNPITTETISIAGVVDDNEAY